MNIILLSKPAAGKGTLASMLKDEFNLEHISSGDLLREEVSKNTNLGVEINNLMTKGALVSDDIVLKLLENKLKTTSKNIILDGIPRNIDQAKKLEEILENNKITHVLLLNVTHDVAVKRVLGRRICPNCKKSYNINNIEFMPKVNNKCDDCNVDLIIRKDDNIESLNERIVQFNVVTSPLINYYKEKDILYEIESSKSHIETFEDVIKILKDKV